MEKVYFSKKVGQGFILDENDNANDFILKKQTTLNGETLIPGSSYKLNDFFIRPVEFAGLFSEEMQLKLFEKPLHLVFFIGEHDGKRYYDIYHKISEQRIFKKYNELSGRDFIFKNGKWK